MNEANLSIIQKLHNLRRDFAEREDALYGAGFDGAAGHAVNNAGCFVLGNRMGAHFFEGAHAIRAVTAHTRQDNHHRFALAGLGHRMEQHIDVGAM